MSLLDKPLLLVSACRDGNVYVHKMENMEQVNIFHIYDDSMLNLLAVCDSKRLFATTPADSSGLYVFNLDSGGAVFEVGGHANIVNAISFSDCGKWLASSSPNQVFVTDIETKKLKYKLGVPGVFGASSLCFSEDGRFLATASNDDAYRIFNMDDGELMHQLGRYNGNPVSGQSVNVMDDHVKLVRFTGDGATVSTVDTNTADSTHVRLSEWDITSGVAIKQKFVSREQCDEVTDLSLDGRLFAWSASGLNDFGVDGSGWYTNNGAYTCAFCSPVLCTCRVISEVLTTKFTPNSQTLVVADTRKIVSFWVFDNAMRHASALLGRLQMPSVVHSFAFAKDQAACDAIELAVQTTKKREVLAMGLHHRLGESSIIGSLDVELVRIIGWIIE
jgi:WD40 repeat protein